jgi:hypothetical protein
MDIPNPSQIVPGDLFAGEPPAQPFDRVMERQEGRGYA